MEGNSANRAAAKDRIISATLKLIGDEGFQNVTVRKIAAVAGVNIAAVSYYFGSKDNVVNEALKYMADKIDKSYNYLDDNNAPPEDRLRNFLRSFSDSMLEHPDVFRNYLNQVACEHKNEIERDEFLKGYRFDKLQNTLKELKNAECDTKIVMRVLQVLGSLVFPMISNAKIKELYGVDYGNSKIRYEYVELLLKNIICE